ncbi:hypothetical protein Tco_0592635 [Tanacetum coccineum]
MLANNLTVLTMLNAPWSTCDQFKAGIEREIAESGKAKLTYAVTPPLAFVKVVEEICVTCGGAHLYYQCLAADDNTFPEYRDNIQGYVAAAAVEVEINVNIKAMQAQINNVKNELRNEMQTSIQASMSNQTNELKNMMASFFQMNTASTSGMGSLPSNTIANLKGELKAITTRSGLVLDGPLVPMTPPFIYPEEDEHVEETLADPELAEYTIKVPPPLVQKTKPPSQRNYVVHQRDPRHPHIPYPSRMNQEKQKEKDEKMLKSLLSNKEKLLELANTPLNENCSAVILKKLPEKLVDPGKFLIPCGFSKLKCKALADLVTDDIFDLEGGIIENLLNLDKTKDLPPYHDNPLSSSTTSSSPRLRFLIYSEDSVEKNSPDDNLVDTISEMFTNEHALDYSSPPLWDDYDDELFDHESVNDNTYDDPFDFKEEKIKDAKILIDELDPRIHHQCATMGKECKEGIMLLYILEDFNPPLYELPFHKEVPGSETLLSFSSENKEKVFNPGILFLKGSILSSPRIIYRGLKLLKSLKFLKARWRFFLALMERTSVFWMFRVSISIPLDQFKYGGIGSS